MDRQTIGLGNGVGALLHRFPGDDGIGAMMGLLTPKPEALEQRAAQHRTRAEQLDREGKFVRAQVERENADRLDRKARALRDRT